MVGEAPCAREPGGQKQGAAEGPAGWSSPVVQDPVGLPGSGLGEAWGCRSQPFPGNPELCPVTCTSPGLQDLDQQGEEGASFPTGWIYLLQGLAVRWPPC